MSNTKEKPIAVIQPDLVDAQEKHKLYPATFEVPALDKLQELKTGTTVKVCAENKERFWVEIIQVDDDGYIARVDNELVIIKTFGYNDLIFIKPENIYQVF